MTEVMWRRDGIRSQLNIPSFPMLESGKITGAVVTVCGYHGAKTGGGELAGERATLPFDFRECPDRNQFLQY